MITSTRIQQYYNKLYTCLRNYLWEYRTVQEICDLELSCYKAIPDLNDIRRSLKRVKQSSMNVARNDEELQEAFEDFESALEDENDVCLKLNVMEEIAR